MNLTLKMWIQIAIGVISYGVWALMAYFDPSLRADFLKFNVILATGTVGLVVRDMSTGSQPSSQQTEPTAQQQKSKEKVES